MYATAEGTARYEARFAPYRDNAFFRSLHNLSVSSLGIGTYLGKPDDATDRAYTDALIVAGENGINFFDTAINYRNQRSERCVGAALQQLQRDEMVVCTKAGFLTPGAIPPSLNQSDVVGGMHSMAPDFLSDQIDRSRANLGVDTVDVFYLHNPETQLGFVDMETFEARIRRAFDRLEELAEQEKLRWYGVATWDGLRSKGALELAKLVEIARETGGADHHFRFAQLPFNAEMVEAFIDRPESVLERAARLGVAVVASGTLKQGQVLAQMDANKAIQFTRSTPGIAVALTGMSHREHVLENLNVAKVPPIPLDEYLRFYR